MVIVPNAIRNAKFLLKRRGFAPVISEHCRVSLITVLKRGHPLFAC